MNSNWKAWEKWCLWRQVADVATGPRKCPTKVGRSPNSDHESSHNHHHHHDRALKHPGHSPATSKNVQKVSKKDAQFVADILTWAPQYQARPRSGLRRCPYWLCHPLA